MLDFWISLEHQFQQWVNLDLAHPWNDWWMKLWSAEWPWLVLLAVFLLYLTQQRSWHTLKAIAWLGLWIGMTDIISAFFLKPWFARLRPCRIENLVRLVDGCAGTFGFPSNHAANAATFAVFCWILWGTRPGLIAWAAAGMIGMSRIYLGVHYPGDILGGFLLGSSMACLGAWVGRNLRFI